MPTLIVKFIHRWSSEYVHPLFLSQITTSLHVTLIKVQWVSKLWECTHRITFFEWTLSLMCFTTLKSLLSAPRVWTFSISRIFLPVAMPLSLLLAILDIIRKIPSSEINPVSKEDFSGLLSSELTTTPRILMMRALKFQISEDVLEGDMELMRNLTRMASSNQEQQ